MFESLTHQTRRFAADDRAVSEVLGAILVFALLVLLLVLVQVNAVPAANKQVEFEHNQRVTQDFQSLQSELYRVASTGTDGAVSIETGVVYPSRFFLINPAPATGTIRTLGPQSITVSNATASGNVRDYWNGTDVSFSTRGIAYTPEYNELPNPGTITWEHSMLYTRFDDGTVLFDDDTSFIDDRQIRLTLLDGNISRGSLSSSLELAPISSQRRTISITNTSDRNVTFTLTTDLDPAELDALEAETFVTNVTSVDDSTVTVTLQQGITYDLQISKVRVGTTIVPPKTPHYITDARGNGTTLQEGTSTRLVAEVRDEYNNPVSNVTVANVTSGEATGNNGTVSVIGSPRTDSEGQVKLRYEAPADVSANRDVSVLTYFNTTGGTLSQAQREVRFDLTVVDADGDSSDGNVSDPDGVSSINPGESGDILLEGVCKDGGNDYYVHLNNTDSPTNVTAARLLFYYGDTGTSIDIGPDMDNLTTITLGGRLTNLTTRVPLSAGSNRVYIDDLNNDGLVGVSLIFDDAERANYFFERRSNSWGVCPA